MKKSATFLLTLLTLVGLSLTSCEKPNPDPEKPGDTTETPGDTITPGGPDQPGDFSFAGVYDMSTATDSVYNNGQGFSYDFYHNVIGKTDPERHGTLTITETSAGHYAVSAELHAEGSGTLYSFTSTAELNAEGQLLIADCDDPSTNDYGIVFSYKFRPIAPAEPLQFKAEMDYSMSGADMQFIWLCTATKR